MTAFISSPAERTPPAVAIRQLDIASLHEFVQQRLDLFRVERSRPEFIRDEMRLTRRGPLKIVEHHSESVGPQRLVPVDRAAQPEAMKLTATRRALFIDSTARSTQMIARAASRLVQFNDRQRGTTCGAASALTSLCGTIGEELSVKNLRHVMPLRVESVGRALLSVRTFVPKPDGQECPSYRPICFRRSASPAVMRSTTRQSSQWTSGSSPDRAM